MSPTPAHPEHAQDSPQPIETDSLLQAAPLTAAHNHRPPLPTVPDGHPEILVWAAHQDRNTGPDPIARYANRDGYAHPSGNTLRCLSRRAFRTVLAAIDRLEDLGLLQVMQQGWQRHPNRYRLAFPGAEDTGTIEEPRRAYAVLVIIAPSPRGASRYDN